MTEQITLEEALRLVSFYQEIEGTWHVEDVNDNVVGYVKGDVLGDVCGDIKGNVRGRVLGDVQGGIAGNVTHTITGNVYGNVIGNVSGYVGGTIAGREYKLVETPKDKLRKLIEESGTNEMLELLNQLEDN